MKVSTRISKWLLEKSESSDTQNHETAPWWKVMCLTGVDYFSTLGYQPSIAFLAAGLLSPVATLILVVVTLCAALPTYMWVAQYSPHGQGSVSMLERLLPGWKSKMLVLALLGFAAMAFVITITLSSADAAAHVVENPLVSEWLSSRMLITMALLIMLGGLFLKGFKEVIGVAVVIVGVYLAINAVLLSYCLYQVAAHPELVSGWWQSVLTTHVSLWDMFLVSALVFPQLALGLSGFETGVMVMPLVDGKRKGSEEHDAAAQGHHDEQAALAGRIANTKKLLISAALIMSVLLIASSLATTILIPQEAMKPHGVADGRALAYLAHTYFGHWFGTVYDITMVAILWFAGSSAMAGLVNLVPRYLPRYGMAPNWARAVRPLVIFFTGVCMFVTVLFDADVHAQGSAYATGVLVFLTAASFAVALEMRKRGWFSTVLFGAITTVFVYTTLVNIWKQPSGLFVALLFLLVILVTSFISRTLRSTELRIDEVVLDDMARKFIEDNLRPDDLIKLVAHKPGGSPYLMKTRETDAIHRVKRDEIVLVEVVVDDSSNFGHPVLEVKGVTRGEQDHPVLKCKGPAIANAMAALALHIRDKYDTVPDIYFGWSSSSPYTNAFRFIFFGEGENAWLTQEVLRCVEPDVRKRPKVHVA